MAGRTVAGPSILAAHQAWYVGAAEVLTADDGVVGVMTGQMVRCYIGKWGVSSLFVVVDESYCFGYSWVTSVRHRMLRHRGRGES